MHVITSEAMVDQASCVFSSARPPAQVLRHDGRRELFRNSPAKTNARASRDSPAPHNP
jgi:hypothetical protein